MLPGKDDLTVCFAHVAYQFEPAFAARGTGVRAFQVWTREDLAAAQRDACINMPEPGFSLLPAGAGAGPGGGSVLRADEGGFIRVPGG